ncbi:hypothetical protein D3C73_1419620 [compost metagenome]
MLRAGSPDEFAGGNDAVVSHVHAEGVLAEANDVVAGLAIEANEAVELVSGLADELGSDAHANLTINDRWFTRVASEWFSLCRGICLGQE